MHQTQLSSCCLHAFWFWHSSDPVSWLLATANSNNSNSSRSVLFFIVTVSHIHTQWSFPYSKQSDLLAYFQQVNIFVGEATWCKAEIFHILTANLNFLEPPDILTALRSQIPLLFPLRDYVDMQKSLWRWSCKMESAGSVRVWSFFRGQEFNCQSVFHLFVAKKPLWERKREINVQMCF